MGQKLITQKDFAAKLREKLPELAEFNDAEIVNKVLQSRPDLVDKIENPMSGDQAAANEQNKLERDSRSLVSQDTWNRHPNVKNFTNSVLQALPGTGAILGGLAATPETVGGGTLLGGSLGAGAGRGLQDIATQALGLGETSPLEKARNIGMDTAITAVTPGILEMTKQPILSARDLTRFGINFKNGMLPKWLGPKLTPAFLEDFANNGREIKFDPLKRPSGIIAKSTERPKVFTKGGQYINKGTGEDITAKITGKEEYDNALKIIRGKEGGLDAEKFGNMDRPSVIKYANDIKADPFNLKTSFNLKGKSSGRNIDDVIKSLLGPME